MTDITGARKNLQIEELQTAIASEINSQLRGKEMEVLVELLLTLT